MNHDTCEDVRVSLAAALDEGHEIALPERHHLSTCGPCSQWLADMQSTIGRLSDLSYPAARGDLWAAVQDRLAVSKRNEREMRRLIVVACVLVAWRSVQLVVDLPIPVLHPFVPFALMVLVFSFVAKDALAIETSAPELQK